MKVVILSLTCTIIMMSGIGYLVYKSRKDQSNYSAQLEYVVFYPGYNDTIKISNDNGYIWGSSEGTNYIYQENGWLDKKERQIYSGSSPFKILYYSKIRNGPTAKQ